MGILRQLFWSGAKEIGHRGVELCFEAVPFPPWGVFRPLRKRNDGLQGRRRFVLKASQHVIIRRMKAAIDSKEQPPPEP